MMILTKQKKGCFLPGKVVFHSGGGWWCACVCGESGVGWGKGGSHPRQAGLGRGALITDTMSFYHLVIVGWFLQMS